MMLHCYCLALLALSGTFVVDGAETYDPVAHPALITRRVTAFTAPIRQLDLAAEEQGRIAAVTVQPGERVPTGDAPIVRLDAELADLAVAAAEAALLARQREADWHAQDRQHAEREAERAEKLFAEGRTAEQARDNALRERDRARGVAAADAGVLAAAEAELQAAKTRRARRDLHAPAGWVVVERLREPGAMVAPGEPILRLADVSELVVQVRVDEAELAALRKQAEMERLAVRFPGKAEPVSARIRRVDVTYDPVSRKRLVELAVSGAAAPEASGGLAIELELAVPDPSGGVIVPAALVEWRLEQAWLRGSDGKELPIVPLRRTSDGLVIAADALPTGTTLVPHPKSGD